MIFIETKTSPFRLIFRRAFRYAGLNCGKQLYTRGLGLSIVAKEVRGRGRDHWEGSGGVVAALAGAAGSRSNVVTPSVAESIRSKRFGFPGVIAVEYLF